MSQPDKKLKDAVARLQKTAVLSINTEQVVNGFIVTIQTRQGTERYLAKDKDEVRELVGGALGCD